MSAMHAPFIGFGEIEIDGTWDTQDIVIDRGNIRLRDKGNLEITGAVARTVDITALPDYNYYVE